MKLKRRPKGPFELIDKVHYLQHFLAKAGDQPTTTVLTGLFKDGLPVFFCTIRPGNR